MKGETTRAVNRIKDSLLDVKSEVFRLDQYAQGPVTSRLPRNCRKREWCRCLHAKRQKPFLLEDSAYGLGFTLLVLTGRVNIDKDNLN